jgi:SAM-dependent methyltransferase
VRLIVDIAKNASLLLPPVQRLYARRRMDHGRKVMKRGGSYPASVFEKHRAAIELVRPIRGRLLEIGPGGDLAVAALFVKHGASEAVCIDNEPWLSDDQEVYAALGVDDEVLGQVRYVSPCSIESAPFEDASFDIVISQACFEHFADPAAAVANIARMLRPGGVTTHAIDLRDHRDFSKPLRFLRYRDLTWRLAMSRRPAAPNRWRSSDYEREFETAGLEIVDLLRDDTVVVTEVERRSFAPRFRDLSLDDLGTTGIFVTAVKPPT